MLKIIGVVAIFLTFSMVHALDVLKPSKGITLSTSQKYVVITLVNSAKSGKAD